MKSLISFLFRVAGLCLLMGSSMQAAIPEPGNLIYGTLTVGTTLITANDNKVVVQLRNGQTVLSSYKMGDNNKAGNHYVLYANLVSDAPEAGYVTLGREVTLYVDGQKADSITISSRGAIIYKELKISILCNSARSGDILSPNTFETIGCGTADSNVIVNNTHTLNLIGATFNGNITIEAGGKLWISGNTILNGNVVLNGGTLEIYSSATVTSQSLVMNSGTVNNNGSLNLEGGSLMGGTLNTSSGKLSISSKLETSKNVTIAAVPRANAGTNQIVMTSEKVYLDGSGSSAPTGIASWKWEQTSGPKVTLLPDNIAKPIFMTPQEVGPNGAVMVFKLTVASNTGHSASATVEVRILGNLDIAVSFSKKGKGLGTITHVDGQKICDNTCNSAKSVFGYLSQQQFMAEPAPGSIFVGWSNACEGRELCSLSADTAQNVVAHFETCNPLTNQQLKSMSTIAAGCYQVKENLVVEPQSSLEIEGGSLLFFDEKVTFSIKGQLAANGLEKKPILFSALNISKRWGGLVFTNAHQAHSTLSYTTLSYAETALLQECCEADAGSLYIYQSQFDHNNIGFRGFSTYPISIVQSKFHDNQTGVFDTQNLTILGSNLYHNIVALSKGKGVIAYSQIHDNDTGIESYPNGFEIHHNQISNNDVGIIFISDPFTKKASLIMSNNNFFDNKDSFKNQQNLDMAIAANWWGNNPDGSIWDNNDDPNLGEVVLDDVLPVVAETSFPLGPRGDTDDDGGMTGADITRMTICVAHQNYVADANKVSDADRLFNISYVKDCSRVRDLDADGSITDADVTRAALCVIHQQFVNDFGATVVEANEQLGIEYDSGCRLMNSTES